MKKIMILLLLFSSIAYADLKVGEPAPNFKLKGNDGKTYSLADMKGEYVVLEWFNNNCPYVDKHYHEDHKNMQKLQAKWIKKATKAARKGKDGKKLGGLKWFTVASSAKGKQGYLTAEEATKIKEEERSANMTAILLDSDGKVGKAYDAKVTPHMFIINPKGVLVYNGAIDDKPSARVSSLKGAKNYVTAALGSLFAGQAVAQATTKPYGCSVKYK